MEFFGLLFENTLVQLDYLKNDAEYYIVEYPVSILYLE